MPFAILPADCEKCGRRRQANYQDRRQAWMPAHARAFLFGGLVLSAFLLPTLFFGVMWLLAGFGHRLPLRKFEMEEMSDCLGFAMVPIAILPGLVGWWYAHRQPRLIPIPCRQCGHVRTCTIQETDVADEPNQERSPIGEIDFTGEKGPDLAPSLPRVLIVEEGSVADKVLERSRKRRRKQAATEAGKNDPNREFDFSKPNEDGAEPGPPATPRTESGPSEDILPAN